MAKSADAFRTISEVADWLGTPAHVLRFWESKFTQVKPVKRAGGRRYYRPTDMELLGGIKQLLHEEGMTIKGVQKLLREKGVSHVAAQSPRSATAGEDDAAEVAVSEASTVDHTAPRDAPPLEALPETPPLPGSMGEPAPGPDMQDSAEEPQTVVPFRTAARSDDAAGAAPQANSAPQFDFMSQRETEATDPPEPPQEAPPVTDPPAPVPPAEEPPVNDPPAETPPSEVPPSDAPPQLAEAALPDDPEDDALSLPDDADAWEADAEADAAAIVQVAPRPAQADVPPDPEDHEIDAAPGLLSWIAAGHVHVDQAHVARIAPLVQQLRDWARQDRTG